MRFRFDKLFPAVDPIVAVHASRTDADASLAALARAGYGRDMLAVIGESGGVGQAARLTRTLAAERPHWAASGILWGLAWAVFTTAATLAMPAGGTGFAALVTLGTLALVLQTAVVSRVIAPRSAVHLQAHGAPSRPTTLPGEAPAWRFLVVVRGSRSDIALAKAVLAA
jgi:hypothetical protein